MIGWRLIHGSVFYNQMCETDVTVTMEMHLAPIIIITTATTTTTSLYPGTLCYYITLCNILQDALEVFHEALRRRPSYYQPQSLYNMLGKNGTVL